MKDKITYKVITSKELKKYEKGLLELIDREGKRLEEIKKSLKNSNYIIIAILNDKIVGSNQIITDDYFYATLINLLVLEKYRNIGIGSELIKLTLKTVLDKGIKNVILVADPKRPWLVNFYSKYGFENSNESGTYMWLDKSKVI
ncbi:MAG: GNAT family N-acetyltransferase [Candidatus Gracilibacteria bacterium]|nr:GNAT family N-acetyltransferase [Candidatus Gracilibacteria bacterium]